MLSKFSVKKPYTVVVAIVLVLILGVVSYTHMSIDLIPSFNLPYAIVSTAYPGATPEQVEQAVTAPLEQGMASISNVKNIQSVSSENSSMVILEFNENTNMDSAMIEMRERLDLLDSYLPEDVGSPMIMKLNPDMMPIVSSAVSLSGTSDEEAAAYINDKVIPELESVEGVASVDATGILSNMVDITLSGEKIDALNADIASFYQTKAEEQIRSAAKAEILKQADAQLAQQKAAMLAQGMPEQMVNTALSQARAQMNSSMNAQLDAIVKKQLAEVEIPNIEITKEMVDGILKGQNLSLPAGSVEAEAGGSYLVRVGDKFTDVESLSALTIMEIPDYGTVKLSDIAQVTSYNNMGDMYSRLNGNYAVVITVQKQPDYSTADVANQLEDRMAGLTQGNPDLTFETLMNQGDYVNMMIDTIVKNLLFGAVLAVIILFVFLRKIKPTLIVGTSIIISVITAFVLMYFSGITLNMISMGGLALGVGMLVDNSIVVIENIYRMRAEGKSAKEAAIEGAKEVSGAVISSTLTTIVVFVPIVFTQGITRQLFTDMALTIAYSLIASLLVALTLVPAASGAMLSKPMETKRNWTDKLGDWYTKILGHSLNHRWVSIVLAVVLLGGSLAAALSAGTQLFPSMDSGSIMVSAQMPDDYDKEDTFAALDELSGIFTGIEDIKTVGIIDSAGQSGMSMMMGSGSTIYLSLKGDRTQSTGQIIDEIRKKTEDKPYELTVSNSNSDMSMLSGGQIVVKVYGRDLDELRSAAVGVADVITGIDGTVEVENGLGKVSQELRITVDKEKALEKGLTVAQVYQAVNQALADPKATTQVSQGSIDYNVYVNDDRQADVKQADLENIQVKNASGESVSVGDVASVELADGFSSIRRNGQERYVSVTASLRDGYNMGDVDRQLEEKLSSYDMPQGCRYEIAGESESIQSTFKDLFLMLALAVVFIYLVMVAQFQSLLSPFIVMFTIPLAFTGGFFALFLTGLPISVISLIGFVVLVGIVVNNGIVFVDYANQQMKKGMSKREALLLTGRNRLRPILMTALTTIIALLVTALDSSSGGELLRPMAVATIGGLTYSTVLTLFIIPALYSLFRREKKQKQAEMQALEEN